MEVWFSVGNLSIKDNLTLLQKQWMTSTNFLFNNSTNQNCNWVWLPQVYPEGLWVTQRGNARDRVKWLPQGSKGYPKDLRVTIMVWGLPTESECYLNGPISNWSYQRLPRGCKDYQRAPEMLNQSEFTCRVRCLWTTLKRVVGYKQVQIWGGRNFPPPLSEKFKLCS